uniref:3-oxo-5-alpha-steroid 4-dehydrogenase C-terminal domain-containing protein n=1 Tax=Triticum urartu TaxID=4572 RepID=A0A8R7PDS8_TRIUA
MLLNTALTISSSYLLSAITMIYARHLAVELPDHTTDLLYPGVLLLAVGIAGNFYHHYLILQLRKGGDNDTGYKIPKGGLFEFITCPHYLFEITGFFGFAMISQTVYALAMASGMAGYLIGEASPPKDGKNPSSRSSRLALRLWCPIS